MLQEGKKEEQIEFLNRLFSYYKMWGENKLEAVRHYNGKGTLLGSPEKDVFRIFDDIQGILPVAVIVGQDPYPQPFTATGIAFANSRESTAPLSPSLQVIKDSVMSFCDGEFDKTLMLWVKQGIMPINVSWTVKYNQPMSHTRFWANFTAGFLRMLSQAQSRICYILLGSTAQMMKPSIRSGKILEEYHPSYYIRNKQPMPPRVWREMISCVYDNFGVKLKLTYDKNE